MKYQDIVRRVWIVATLVAGVLLIGSPALVGATCSQNQQTCSSSYGVNEVFFGTGGQLCDPANSSGVSTNYCAKSAVGETGVGNTKGTAFQAQTGFNTDRTPSLTFIVNAASINLGTLTAGTTQTATATFSVKTYLASGYQVTTESPPPQNGAYTMQAPVSATFSAPTSEQFGMNLVANASCGGGLPASLGANPQQIPDATFSFGVAATGYNTACQFKYVNHDIIARSTQSSGETDYTISYIFNTTNVTPGGIYTFNQVLVATGTF